MSRMAGLADLQRYEDAARWRDRLASLLRAAHRTQRLRSLTDEAELVAAAPHAEGWEVHVMRHGRLAAAGVMPAGTLPQPWVDTLLASAESVLSGFGPVPAATAEETELAALARHPRSSSRPRRVASPARRWCPPPGSAHRIREARRDREIGRLGFVVDMRVGRTKRAILDDGRHRTSVRVTFDDGTHDRLWFVTSGDIPFVQIDAADIWLPVMLVVAMRRRENLELVEPISERAESLDRVQDVLTTWYSEDMHRVAISAPLPQKPANLRLMGRRRGRGVGSMFSGGVDSFHTLAKNRDGIDALIYGFGIDVPVRKSGAVERVHAILEDVAADSGKRLLVADTNIRKFLKNDTLWSRESHGAALTSLATVFSTVIDRAYPRHTYVRGESALGIASPAGRALVDT